MRERTTVFLDHLFFFLFFSFFFCRGVAGGRGTKRQGEVGGRGRGRWEGDRGGRGGAGGEIDQKTKEKRIAERETLRAQQGGTRRKTPHFEAVCVSVRARHHPVTVTNLCWLSDGERRPRPGLSFVKTRSEPISSRLFASFPC